MAAQESIIDENTVALVTGAAAGIGLAVSRRLVERGARVVCADRNAEKLSVFAEEAGAKVHAVVVDLNSLDSIQQALSSLPKDWQCVDILVNNAAHAIGGQRPFYKGRLADWEGIIDTNVQGMLRVTHAILPGMVERDGGHIVNIGSTASLMRYQSEAVYIASKHAVHGFSEGLREDLAASGVRVTEVLPDIVGSDFHMTRFRGDTSAAEAYQSTYHGSLEPDDIARVVIMVLDQPLDVTVDQVVVARTRYR